MSLCSLDVVYWPPSRFRRDHVVLIRIPPFIPLFDDIFLFLVFFIFIYFILFYWFVVFVFNLAEGSVI